MRPARRFSCTTSPRSTRGVAALVSCLGFHPFQARTFLSVGLGSAAICRKYLALSCGMLSVSATWVTSHGGFLVGCLLQVGDEFVHVPFGQCSNGLPVQQFRGVSGL